MQKLESDSNRFAPYSNEMRMADEIKKSKALNIALGDGIVYGVGGLAVVGMGTYLATKFSPSFNKSTGISTKMSLPVMAGLFLFSAKYELVIADISRRPEAYGLSEESVLKGTPSRMPAHHRILNFVYDNPFSLIISLGVPFAGAVLYQQMQLNHLTISQRVMHSRVFAQAGILTIALSTMAFREYMNKNGRFPEPK